MYVCASWLFCSIYFEGCVQSHIYPACFIFPLGLAFAASIFLAVTEVRESEVYINVSLFLTLLTCLEWNLHSSVPCNANPAAVLDCTVKRKRDLFPYFCFSGKQLCTSPTALHVDNTTCTTGKRNTYETPLHHEADRGSCASGSNCCQRAVQLQRHDGQPWRSDPQRSVCTMFACLNHFPFNRSLAGAGVTVSPHCLGFVWTTGPCSLHAANYNGGVPITVTCTGTTWGPAVLSADPCAPMPIVANAGTITGNEGDTKPVVCNSGYTCDQATCNVMCTNNAFTFVAQTPAVTAIPTCIRM